MRASILLICLSSICWQESLAQAPSSRDKEVLNRLGRANYGPSDACPEGLRAWPYTLEEHQQWGADEQAFSACAQSIATGFVVCSKREPPMKLHYRETFRGRDPSLCAQDLVNPGWCPWTKASIDPAMMDTSGEYIRLILSYGKKASPNKQAFKASKLRLFGTSLAKRRSKHSVLTAEVTIGAQCDQPAEADDIAIEVNGRPTAVFGGTFRFESLPGGQMVRLELAEPTREKYQFLHQNRQVEWLDVGCEEKSCDTVRLCLVERQDERSLAAIRATPSSPPAPAAPPPPLPAHPATRLSPLQASTADPSSPSLSPPPATEMDRTLLKPLLGTLVLISATSRLEDEYPELVDALADFVSDSSGYAGRLALVLSDGRNRPTSMDLEMGIQSRGVAADLKSFRIDAESTPYPLDDLEYARNQIDRNDDLRDKVVYIVPSDPICRLISPRALQGYLDAIDIVVFEIKRPNGYASPVCLTQANHHYVSVEDLRSALEVEAVTWR